MKINWEGTEVQCYDLATNYQPDATEDCIKAVRTGEYRVPKKGDWYLGMPTPVAYCAQENGFKETWILRLVRWIPIVTTIAATLTPEQNKRYNPSNISNKGD
jgi:hypothetical protein